MRFDKDIKYAIPALIMFVFEVAFGKYIAVSGAVPMLTFSFLIVCALVENELSYTVMLALIFGVFADALYGHGFGTYTVSFIFAVFYTFRLKDSIFSSRWLFLVFDAFIMTVTVQIFYMIIHIGDIGSGNFWRCMFSISLPTAVYNTVICCFVYFIFEKFLKKRR